MNTTNTPAAIASVTAYSHDGVHFSSDKDKAVKALADSGRMSASSFVVVTQARPFDAADFSTETDVERILEQWSADLADEVGQADDCPFMDVSDAAKLELQALLAGWVRRHVDLTDQLLIVQAPVSHELVAQEQAANDAQPQAGVAHG